LTKGLLNQNLKEKELLVLIFKIEKTKFVESMEIREHSTIKPLGSQNI
jgi:hypothetical protein